MSLFQFITMSFTCKRPNFYYKISKDSGKLLFCESRDPFLASAMVSENTINWVASDAVTNTKGRLEFKKIMGYHQHHLFALE